MYKVNNLQNFIFRLLQIGVYLCKKNKILIFTVYVLITFYINKFYIVNNKYVL